MEISVFFGILISTIFINNYVLAQTLGLCPFLGVSQRLDLAFGMGVAVTFVMTLASAATFIVYKYILLKYDLIYLKTVVFILIIASFVQLVEMAMEKFSPALYRSLGIFLPLIATNCVVLGVTLLNITSGFVTADAGFLKSIVQGAGAGVGFILALVIMAGIRERLEFADIPKNLQGLPITFMISGLLALAFLGFTGMKI